MANPFSSGEIDNANFDEVNAFGAPPPPAPSDFSPATAVDPPAFTADAPTFDAPPPTFDAPPTFEAAPPPTFDPPVATIQVEVNAPPAPTPTVVEAPPPTTTLPTSTVPAFQTTFARFQTTAQNLEKTANAAVAEGQAKANEQIAAHAAAAENAVQAAAVTAAKAQQDALEASKKVDTGALLQAGAKLQQDAAKAAAVAQKTAVETGAKIGARAEMEAQYAKLKLRELELTAKETDLAHKEKEFGQWLKKGEPNWPRKFCCISPMVHHEIIGDIPVERQNFVKTCYMNYFFTCFILICNAICSVIVLSAPKVEGAPDEKDSSVWTQHFGVSIVHLLGIPFAFIIWYWPIYKACGKASSSQYVIGFIGSVVALLYDVFCAVGINGYGGCGLTYCFAAKAQKGDVGFIPSITVAFLYIAQGTLFVWIIFRLHKYYTQDKSSLAKAKRELLFDVVV